jgi:hypothetical protein
MEWLKHEALSSNPTTAKKKKKRKKERKKDRKKNLLDETGEDF